MKMIVCKSHVSGIVGKRPLVVCTLCWLLAAVISISGPIVFSYDGEKKECTLNLTRDGTTVWYISFIVVPHDCVNEVFRNHWFGEMLIDSCESNKYLNLWKSLMYFEWMLIKTYWYLIRQICIFKAALAKSFIGKTLCLKVGKKRLDFFLNIKFWNKHRLF